MNLVTRPLPLAAVPKVVWACIALGAICNVIILVPLYLVGSPCLNTGSRELDQVGGVVRQLPIVNGNTSALPQPSPRDVHMHNVLESLASRHRQESFEKIFQTNEWGSDESHSGLGSTVEYTRNARLLLATAIKTLEIKDMIDSPCGDCNWQWRVEGLNNVAYLGLDIVPDLIEGNKKTLKWRRNMHFKQQDFVYEPYPHMPDLILCRDMIQHNSLEDGVRAYYNMEKSGAKYLATGWYHMGQENPMGHNTNQPPGGMYNVNVFLHPFNFTVPEFFIRDGDIENKTLGVWKLPALGLGDGKFFELSEHIWEEFQHRVIDPKQDMGL